MHLASKPRTEIRRVVRLGIQGIHQRTVAIPEAILGRLAVHLAHHAQPGPDGLVFTTRDGNPVSRHNRSWWRRACRIVGLDERAHLHDCRHAGLTLAAQPGATLRELMALGGHSPPRTPTDLLGSGGGRARYVPAGFGVPSVPSGDESSTGPVSGRGVDRASQADTPRASSAARSWVAFW